MTLAETLTIIVLVINVLALLAVAYQIYQNSKSILLTKKSIDDERKTRQAQLLPSVYYIIHVQVRLKGWLDDIAEILESLEHSFAAKDVEGAKQEASRALTNPKGLVDSFLFKKGPDWISQLYMSAAQHYYEFHSTLSSFQNASIQTADYTLISDIINVGKRSSNNIKNLLVYIKWIVPDSVANTPASLSDRDFLSD